MMIEIVMKLGFISLAYVVACREVIEMSNTRK